MKHLWIFFFAWGCIGTTSILKDPVVEMQAESMERIANKIQSGKQVDKEDIVASLRSGKTTIRQLVNDGSVNREKLEKCEIEKSKLAKQAGEAAMVKWLYYAFIGLIGIIILLIAALLVAKKALKVASAIPTSPADFIKEVLQ